MWKQTLFFLIGLIVISFSATRASDLKGRFGLSVRGGAVGPIGAFGHLDKLRADGGYGFGVTAEYFASNRFAVGGTFGYTINGVKNIDPTIHLDYKIRNLGAFAKYIFPIEDVVPYIRLDLGLYKLKTTLSSGPFESSLNYDSKFGFGGGGGVMFEVGDNWLFSMEVLLHNTMTEGAKADIGGEQLEMLYDIQFCTLFLSATFLI
jgi:opacity protein-like surface antigen